MGVSELRPDGSIGQLYMSSKEESEVGFLGRARSRSRAKGRSFVQSRWSSMASLVKMDLRILLVLSTLPEDCGWYGIWKYQGILRALAVVWETWQINSGPLSDCKEVGTPKRGMISDNTMVETV